MTIWDLTAGMTALLRDLGSLIWQNLTSVTILALVLVVSRLWYQVRELQRKVNRYHMRVQFLWENHHHLESISHLENLRPWPKPEPGPTQEGT